MAIAGEQRDADRDDSVVAAIERVLKIERDGVEMLRQSADDAQRLLTDTRARGAALARRADACISKLHAAYHEKIERDINALKQAHAARGPGAEAHYDPAKLAAAAQRLAAKLTGGA